MKTQQSSLSTFCFRSFSGLLIVLVLMHISTARGQTSVKEADLVGTWHSTDSNLAAVEATYFADHHYSTSFFGIVVGTMTGPWRIEDGKIVTKWTGGTLTFAGKKKHEADGGEQRVALIKLEGDTLATKEPDESQSSVFKRGPIPKK